MEKKSLGILAMVAMVLLGLVLFGADDKKEPEKEKAQPKYIGAKQCKMCHSSEKKGNQFGQWQKSTHAKAYETLATDKAKETAKKVDKDIKDPQKSDKCLKCHVTAFGVDTKLIAETFKAEDGVQCETCHGAGSDYKPIPVMKDRAKAIEKGLIIPEGKMCRTCHNKESPNYTPFCFMRYYDKVSHFDPNLKHKKPECDCNKDKDGKCIDECKDECNKLIEENKKKNKEENK